MRRQFRRPLLVNQRSHSSFIGPPGLDVYREREGSSGACNRKQRSAGLTGEKHFEVARQNPFADHGVLVMNDEVYDA